MTDTATTFSELGLSNDVLEAITTVGYETPSPIQAECIPHLMSGKDVLGMAQTGTGKTAAFALPLLSKLDVSKNHTQIMVLTPTRELAIQVAEAFKSYATKIAGFKVLPIYGGQDMYTQLKQLKRGVHVVVGTPGRMMDHLRRNSLNLSNLSAVVLDEADEMLRMGFIEDVEWILEHTPKEKQVALFSATMPKQIRSVAENYLNNPTEIKIASKTSTVEKIDQKYWMVNNGQKLDALTRMLELIEFDGMIIFTRTRNTTLELGEKLAARGFAAAPLNGDMNQAVRERTISQLKSGRLDIVIATDVAARGIDVERISHVVNYDMPYDVESYVHRIGRTGRAGRSGNAILFVTPRERRLLQLIERTTRQKLELLAPPTSEEVTQQRVSAFKERISDVVAGQDLDFFQKVINEFTAEHPQVETEQVLAALTLMAQMEQPLRVSSKPIPGHTGRMDRDDRGDRGGRDRGGRDRGERGGDRGSRERNSENMTRYRIEVGREHQATPRDIVGAIANEAGISSRDIGAIRLFDNFSTVELASNTPSPKLDKLKSVRVRSRQMELSVDQGPRGGSDRGSKGAPRRGNENRGGGENKSNRGPRRS